LLFARDYTIYKLFRKRRRTHAIHYASYLEKRGECILCMRDYTIYKLFREKGRMHTIYEGLHIKQAIQGKGENAYYL
jgi:hypothetical protein